MPTNKRTRANAFQDFPASDAVTAPETIPPKSIQPTAAAQQPAKVERIERLKPSQMLPDRFQPRRLLPAEIRAHFFSGQVDCYQAAAEWLALAQRDPAHREQVEHLLAMGDSFDEHGQIKPITGSWVENGSGQFIFQIETGERRFWAACLQAVKEKRGEEPELRVEAVEHPTRQRQVLENRHAEPPSAVSQACEIAALILAERGVQPNPAIRDDYEFFRLAREQRMPTGVWDKIIPVMQVTRPRMVQLLNILQLPTPLLDLANRYRLPERVLREILVQPRERWENLLRVSAQNQLTAEDIPEVAASHQIEKAAQERTYGKGPYYPHRVGLAGLRRFVNAVGELDEFGQAQVLDEIADTLVVSRQAESLLILMHELAHRLEIRMANLVPPSPRPKL